MGSGGTGCVSYRNLRTWSSLIRQHPVGCRAGVYLFCVLLDRHPTRPRRGENRNPLHQHLFFVVFCKYKHLGVRVPLFFLLRNAKLYDLARFIDLPREPWAR